MYKFPTTFPHTTEIVLSLGQFTTKPNGVSGLLPLVVVVSAIFVVVSETFVVSGAFVVISPFPVTLTVPEILSDSIPSFIVHTSTVWLPTEYPSNLYSAHPTVSFTFTPSI